jgi:hypothetical protein
MDRLFASVARVGRIPSAERIDVRLSRELLARQPVWC